MATVIRSRLIITLYLTVICILNFILNCHSMEIYLSPTDVTAFDGHYATFQCITSGRGGLLFWFANGDHIHQLPSDHDASFISVQRSDGHTGENSTLRVLASELTNNTNYTCGISDLFTHLTVNYSTPARLAVQGIPLPPTGLNICLEIKLVEDTHDIGIILSWNRPFTLFDEFRKSNESSSSLEYIIHGYFRNSGKMFYSNTSKDYTHKIYFADLNVIDICDNGLEHTLFAVSAKFVEIGEGNMSDAITFTKSTAVIDFLCVPATTDSSFETSACTYPINVAIFGPVSAVCSFLIILFSAALIVILIVKGCRVKRTKVVKNMKRNVAYEVTLGNKSPKSETYTPVYDEPIDRRVKVQLQSNSAYISTTV